jgi:hypothetical protein
MVIIPVRNIYLERPVSDYGVNNLDGTDFVGDIG